MEIDRSLKTITCDDLKELYAGSVKRLNEYFILGGGAKWKKLYDIKNPIAVALCQGAAMHFHDGTNGIKDFDIWFFYPYNQKHLPYRTIWSWDYVNPKFGRHPSMPDYKGRKVDVLVRSIRNHSSNDPVESLRHYLTAKNSASSRELAKKAVVMLMPTRLLGRVIWYKQEV
jgi:hypothetical protein